MLRLVRESLAASGVEAAQTEARLLLMAATGASRTEALRGLGRVLSPEECSILAALVARRNDGEPLAYITSEREFMGLGFMVTPDVLIPRPETELLVELALEHVADHRSVRIAEPCTGSGCVAVAIAARAPCVQVVASDISARALSVAAMNVGRHGVQERVSLVRADMLTHLRAGSVQIVLANPPYIATADIPGLQAEVRREPAVALDAGPDGMGPLRRLVQQASHALCPGGLFASEIGAGQGPVAVETVTGVGFAHVGVLPDLAGIPRVVYGRRHG